MLKTCVNKTWGNCINPDWNKIPNLLLFSILMKLIVKYFLEMHHFITSPYWWCMIHLLWTYKQRWVWKPRPQSNWYGRACCCRIPLYYKDYKYQSSFRLCTVKKHGCALKHRWIYSYVSFFFRFIVGTERFYTAVWYIWYYQRDICHTRWWNKSPFVVC